MTEANIKKVLDRFEEIFFEILEKRVSERNFKRERDAKRFYLSELEYRFRRAKLQILRELWDGKIV